jgi:predicted metal-dependent hydrolase
MGEDDVIDYVVVATLAHVIEPNRTSAYWAIVEKILPDYRERQERLRVLQERLKAEDWI